MGYGGFKNGYSRGKGRDVAVNFLAKDFSEPLDIERIAAVICLSGTFRHLMFKILESRDRTIDSSYGYPLLGVYPELPLIDGDYVVWASRLWKKDDATDWVQREAERLNSAIAEEHKESDWWMK